MTRTESDAKRLGYDIIREWVEPGASVLEVGCGDGDLLALLAEEKGARAEGIDADEVSIHRCVARGLSIVHRDLGAGLAECPTGSFDYVILNQSLQRVTHLEAALADALRVGKKVIVVFPNFAHVVARLQLFFQGKTPVTPALPHEWYDTPNLHFLSVSDFVAYCRKKGVRIERCAFTSNGREVRVLTNLRAMLGAFLVSRNES